MCYITLADLELNNPPASLSLKYWDYKSTTTMLIDGNILDHHPVSCRRSQVRKPAGLGLRL